MFHLCLSLAHLLTLCHIEATSRRKGGTRTDPPALQGYHHSPPHSSPLISSAIAPWENAKPYIFVLSLNYYLLTYSLCPSLPPCVLWKESWISLSIFILGLLNFACSIPGHNHQDSGRTKFFVCLSVCYFAHFLTEIRLM